MKNILYYLIPIVSILFLVSCDEDDDKASESFMLKHDKTKWKYVGTDGTISFIYIDMDKIKDYYNDPNNGINKCFIVQRIKELKQRQLQNNLEKRNFFRIFTSVNN